jgi:hypothetical protein
MIYNVAYWTSLGVTQAIVSTPLAFNSLYLARKLGTCCSLQVGVKAPGTENKTTVFPFHSTEGSKSLGLQLEPEEGVLLVLKFTLGKALPVWMANLLSNLNELLILFFIIW